MKLDEMIAKINRKTKVDQVLTRKVIREVLASMKEEISAAEVGSRVQVPTLGVFVVRPGKEGEKNRIILNLAQRPEKEADVPRDS